MIRYSKVITGPTELPATVEEFKVHLKVDGNSEDALLESKLRTATGLCEKYAGLSFATQTRRVTLDNFYCKDVVLPYGPVQSISVFTYVNDAGDTIPIDSNAYTLDLQSPIAKVRVTDDWPYTNGVLNNTVIEYVAGTDSIDVPFEAKEAILRLATRLYENRGDQDGELMDESVTDLLDLIKVYWIA